MKWFLGLFSPSLNFRAYFTFSQAHIYQFDHLQMFITGLKCPFCDYFVFFFLFLLYLLSFIIIISVFSKSPSVLLCVFFSYRLLQGHWSVCPLPLASLCLELWDTTSNRGGTWHLLPTQPESSSFCFQCMCHNMDQKTDQRILFCN